MDDYVYVVIWPENADVFASREALLASYGRSSIEGGPEIAPNIVDEARAAPGEAVRGTGDWTLRYLLVRS